MEMMDFAKIVLIRSNELKESGERKRNINCLELSKSLYLIHREYFAKTGNRLINNGETCYTRSEDFRCFLNKEVYSFFSRWGAEDINWYSEKKTEEEMKNHGVKYIKILINIIDKYLSMEYMEIGRIQSEGYLFNRGNYDISEDNIKLDSMQHMGEFIDGFYK